ncbi:MAG: SpoIID/LytB domain-containing protein [bacterium]|nr:SpoIID/LytB domain-containing protein [bacterium]
MRKGPAFMLALLWALSLCACTRANADALCEIRVVLSDGSVTEQVGGELEWSKASSSMGASSDPVEVKVVAGEVKATLGAKGIQSQRLVATPRSGYVRFGGQQYRGRLELFVGKSGNIVVLNVLPLEDYLLGVVPSEMPSGWPQPALQAQAVAARTYAVSRMLDRRSETFDVYSSVSDQVYHGVSGEKQGATQAVLATAGQIVTHNGKPIVAYYCSDAGGCTKCGTQPYLQAVPIESPDSPHNQWSIPLSRAELGKLAARMGTDVGAVQRVTSKQDGDSGHLLALTIYGDAGHASIAGTKLRSLLGLSTMKSTRAWIQIAGQPSTEPKIIATKSQLPPKQKLKAVATDSANDVVEVPTGKGTSNIKGQAVALVEGTTELPPHSRPYIMFADGQGSRKLRTAYATDGDVLIDCARSVIVSSMPITAKPAVESIRQLTAVKKTTPSIKPSEVKSGVSGEISEAGIVIHGSGYGHGMGMSQWGAKTLAERGLSYEQILAYFYSGVELAQVPRSLGSIASAKPVKAPTAKSVKADDAEQDEAITVGESKFAPGRQ